MHIADQILTILEATEEAFNTKGLQTPSNFLPGNPNITFAGTIMSCSERIQFPIKLSV
jgi:hypothetical protein